MIQRQRELEAQENPMVRSIGAHVSALVDRLSHYRLSVPSTYGRNDELDPDDAIFVQDVGTEGDQVYGYRTSSILVTEPSTNITRRYAFTRYEIPEEGVHSAIAVDTQTKEGHGVSELYTIGTEIRHELVDMNTGIGVPARQLMDREVKLLAERLQEVEAEVAAGRFVVDDEPLPRTSN